jgi:hypothetical protein
MTKKPIPTGAAAAPDDPSLAAFIESEVERAIQPYLGLFPKDVLDGFRERLAVFYATHPAVAPLVEAARPRSSPKESIVLETPDGSKPAAGGSIKGPSKGGKQSAKR